VGSVLLVVTLLLAGTVAVLAVATRRASGPDPSHAAAGGWSLASGWKLLQARGDTLERAAELVRDGRKVEAVELVREATSLSLVEARHAIDSLEHQLATRGTLARLLAIEPPAPSSWLEEVRSALRSGQKLEAIRIYRERSGLGLAEAKAAVEALGEAIRATGS
jgi:ribosomal protein L7/L12